jgi:hypothetical protein
MPLNMGREARSRKMPRLSQDAGWNILDKSMYCI